MWMKNYNIYELSLCYWLLIWFDLIWFELVIADSFDDYCCCCYYSLNFLSFFFPLSLFSFAVFILPKGKKKKVQQIKIFFTKKNNNLGVYLCTKIGLDQLLYYLSKSSKSIGEGYMVLLFLMLWILKIVIIWMGGLSINGDVKQ